MNDSDLRGRFAQLRGEEGRTAPSFASMTHPPRSRFLRRLAPVLALLLLVVMLVVVDRRQRTDFSREDRAAAQRLAAWRAPTDVLLETPGRDLLVSTPDIPSTELPKGVFP
jgi:hypothetical protein